AGWSAIAGSWGAVTRAGGLALSTAKLVPAPVVSAVTSVGRAVLGNDTVPAYSRDLPKGGSARRAAPRVDAEAVFFPSCTGTMFGPATPAESGGAMAAFSTLCDRAGVVVTVPEGIESACCGTPWKSKGYTDGYARMSTRTLDLLWEASDHGRLPVVCDASSCTEGL